MNNKGFTIVELITTFALSALIIILLMNVVIIIKNVYTKSNIKSELYINQYNLSNTINSKLNKKKLISYEECTEEEMCYNFNFEDEIIKLKVTQKTIKFGNYVYNLDEKTTVQNPSVDIEYVNLNDVNNTDSFLVIKIPIVNEMYPGIDFGVNIIYRY